MVRLLCNTLERAGPTAIKLGQWVSTRPDLFLPELCVHFSARLHAAVAPHSAAHSRSALAAVLAPAGLALEDVFESMDFETALGSGSIAQVHRARLRPEVARRAWSRTEKTIGESEDGADVVVKILHPGVGESVALDMALLEGATGFLTHCVGGV